MRTPCLKFLCPERYFLTPSIGFTLIETLVVVAIMIILIGVGVASYNNFNQNQILSQAASTLVTNLRDAQNRALSGEKNCSSSACGGANSICDNGVGDKPLDGWYVNFALSSYTIKGHCGGLPPAGTDFSIITVNLPSQLEFSAPPPPSPNPILFKSLTLSTNVPVSTTITLKLQDDPSKLKKITVYTSGEIKLQ